MSETIQVVTEDFLSVTITSNIKSFGVEKRFPKSLTIAALKASIQLERVKTEQVAIFRMLFHPDSYCHSLFYSFGHCLLVRILNRYETQ